MVKKNIKKKENQINDIVVIDLVKDQIIQARNQLDKETLNALRDLKTKTIGEIYRILKTVIRDEDRYRKIKNFVLNEIKSDKFLSSKIDDSILNKHFSLDLSNTVKERAKELIGKVSVQGWLEYYWDWDLKAYKLIPMAHVNTIYFLEDTKELFLLDEPTKLFKGKPVFTVIRGIPFAIPLEFRIVELTDEINKIKELDKRFVFGRAHLSTWDLYAKFKSIIVDRIFKPNKLTLKNMLGYFLAFIFGCMTVYIILSPYLVFMAGGE